MSDKVEMVITEIEDTLLENSGIDSMNDGIFISTDNHTLNGSIESLDCENKVNRLLVVFLYKGHVLNISIVFI